MRKRAKKTSTVGGLAVCTHLVCACRHISVPEGGKVPASYVAVVINPLLLIAGFPPDPDPGPHTLHARSNQKADGP